MNFSHNYADQIEAAFPVVVTQWGTQGAPAVVVKPDVSDDEGVKVIHEAASWLREQGFVDIRFETGHDEHEGEPVLVLRHPWVEDSTETEPLDVEGIVALVKSGNAKEAVKQLSQKPKNAQVEIAREDISTSLESGLDSLSNALQYLDEVVFSLGAYDSRNELDETTSNQAYELTERVDELSGLAVVMKRLVDDIEKNL